MSAPPAVGERARSPSCSPTPVRGGTARSTSTCSRACSPTAGPGAPSGSSSRRWRRSRTKTGAVCDLSTEQLCAAAGIDRPDLPPRASGVARYGTARARRAALGGRGNTNVWSVRDPRASGEGLPHRAPRRVSPPAGARPLVAAASSDRGAAALEPSTTSGEKGGQDQTLWRGNRPILTGVSAVKGGHSRTLSAENCPVLTGVSAAKGGQDQTLFELGPPETPAQTPAKTPAETPAPNARAGREPQNPRTRKDPPSPPEGGSSPDSVTVEQSYVTERGRRATTPRTY